MKNTSRTLITDVDDVLLDWLRGGFRPFAEIELGRPLNPAGPEDWDMDRWLGTKPEQTRRLVEAFNDSDKFGELPAFPDAIRAMRSASAAGFEIHVVTSCSSSDRIVSLRRENLVAQFGDIFSSITCLDLGVSKRKPLAALHHRYGSAVWVEDSHKNALIGADVGHRTFLIRRSHNRPIEATCMRRDITWVDCWNSILPEIGLEVGRSVAAE